MTEKLTINLTDGDVSVKQNERPKGKEFIEYLARCPICDDEITITRLHGHTCLCLIEWNVEVKIKGTRAVDDDEKFQIPLPMDNKDATNTG